MLCSIYIVTMKIMEQFLGFFISNDSLVVSILVAVIAIILLLLLIMSFRNPEGVVLNEMGSAEGSNSDIEGALRKVLGEQRWMNRSQAADANAEATAALDGASEEDLKRLESEVLEKDKQIAELNKQLTQGGGAAEGEGGGNDAELLDKIKGLQDRLKEYEIIEDDIADLSLYKTENAKLKEELARLQGAAPEEVAEPVAEEEPPAAEAAEPEADLGETHIPESTESEDDAWGDVEDDAAASFGKDLVAEFEKVVNNQEASDGDEDFGDVDVMSPDAKDPMENVKPDSKEEAEVLIGDLKLLKKEKKE